MTERAKKGIFMSNLHFGDLISNLLAIYFIER